MTFISAMQTTRSMSAQLLVKAWMIGAFGTSPCCAFLGEGGRFLDFATNDVARDDDDDAEQERDAPAPGLERVARA